MFEFSQQSMEFQGGLERFMNEHIYPNEKAYAEQLHGAENRFDAMPLMDELKSEARQRWKSSLILWSCKYHTFFLLSI